MKARKPKEIVVGRTYRMWAPFRAGPSNLIALVTEIIQVTKTTRNVRVEWLRDGPDWGSDPGWRLDGYGHFLSCVHSDAPHALQ